MIKVEHLVKSYGTHYALSDVSFEIAEGEVVGFLGPNGAGKSTTMNILTGCLSSNAGSVSVNGADILKNPAEAKRQIGYLPEQPPLYTDMTVEEYLGFVYDLKRCTLPKQAHIAEVCEVVRIADVRRRLIRNLSKGYRQRVGIAQALIGNPPVLIFDEPTVGLDPLQIIEIRDLIKELAKEHTIILSSHIMQEISAVCDHIMIISHGKLVLSGTPEELQQQANRGENIELEVPGDKARVQEVVSSVAGISEIEEIACERENTVALRIKSREDLREALFFAFAKANLPLIKLVRNTKTLEDIFLEATSSTWNVTAPAEEEAVADEQTGEKEEA